MTEYKPPRFAPDVQAQQPTLPISLSRVGVTGVEKVVRIKMAEGDQLFMAKMECYVDLGPEQKGAHMSRFEETVNDVISEVVFGDSQFRIERVAERIAMEVRERQDATRAEVSIEARYPEHKPAPVSGIKTQEIYTLLGSAVAYEGATRRIIGVQAQGMTACPCAQQIVAGKARETLQGEGFTDEQIDQIFDAVPVATHNQRGLGTLHVGLPAGSDVDLDARVLLDIVEDSMSSEIYEMMKRTDEAAVVEKAHRKPRFVEDCVREMIGGVVSNLGHLDDHCWISARQENLETIHQHNVAAERHGLLGDMRSEVEKDTPCISNLTREGWLLDGPPQQSA
jgi:GTP cyclohydrolase I/GTP cyclohydrolase-4